ncbi:hypothetical protein CEXT_300291 [Caerostris extrusa]|uniref:Uncharacterized protein n=1 Tax=Caerostris extrusa TaxID=172846 RepID=A0AAV4V7K4_CAEEX|nr:hypothetical protein CEXT_300291 [Caerostris extrusa]
MSPSIHTQSNAFECPEKLHQCNRHFCNQEVMNSTTLKKLGEEDEEKLMDIYPDWWSLFQILEIRSFLTFTCISFRYLQYLKEMQVEFFRKNGENYI